LYVIASGNGFRVGAGDLIHLIDGRPALPQSLQRARFAHSPVSVRIRRSNGTLQEATLP
jgi:hypothetical protein